MKHILKKGSAVFLFLLFFFFITGCSNTSIIPDDNATNKGYSLSRNYTTSSEHLASSKTVKTSNQGIPKETIKVGVIHLSDPSVGNGYSYTHDLGIQQMQDNLGLRDDQIIRKIDIDDTDQEATSKAIQECIDEGCHIIFTTSWGYMETTAKFAEQYPDIYFSHATGYLSNGKNFNNYFGRIYQVRYLSGIAAGLKTESNKIGYVAAMGSENSEVTGGIDAFALGVYSVNPDAVIYVKVTNSWYDPEKEAAASAELLDMGCDVMTQHCDTSYPQTMAQERHVWGIGYNSDMSRETPYSTLCSVIWNWNAYYTFAVQSVIDGTWDGSNYYGGIADGLVQLTALSDFNAPEAQEKIDEATNKILNDTFHVFDGVMETNTGDTVGEAGKTLDDSTITGNINWYFKNVIVVE